MAYTCLQLDLLGGAGDLTYCFQQHTLRSSQNALPYRFPPVPHGTVAQSNVRVYDLGSMPAAGRDLRTSPAVTSARISRLEDHLSVRWFQRATRKSCI